MSGSESLCSLVLDEMSITPGRQWDVKSDSFIGSITIGDDSGGNKATKCLAIMLAGIVVRWKQVVYYHFTGKKRASNISNFELSLKVLVLHYLANNFCVFR